MKITFPCKKCGHKLKGGSELAGKRVKCTRCQAVQRVPATEVNEDELMDILFGPDVAASPQGPPASQPPVPVAEVAAVRGAASPAPRSQQTSMPVSQNTSLRRPVMVWFGVGTVAFLLVLLAVNIIPWLNANRRPAPVASPSESPAPSTVWRITGAVLATTDKGLDITHEYSETRGNGTFSLRPKERNRLVIVHWTLSALKPDEGVPTGLPPNKQYRFFSMASAGLFRPQGKCGTFVWPIDPEKRYTRNVFLMGADALVFGGSDPEPPWYQTYLSNRSGTSFHGYLEVNRPIGVSFLAEVTELQSLTQLQLQIEPDPPVFVKVERGSS